MALIQTKPLGVMIGGPRGPRGIPGPTGPGVPNGGATGEVLAKTADGDQSTAWRAVVLSLAGRTGNVTLTKADVGLGQVDNTPDNAKPVSGPQQAALDTKANLDSPTFTGTVRGITAAMVGLTNVNNTSDAAKPVSIAQQAALDLKAPLASPSFTGTVSGITKAMVGLANVDNTSDINKPVSAAVAAALALRAPLANPVFTGIVQGLTKSMVGLNLVDNTADSDKPVSNPVRAALDLKANASNPTFTGTVSGITKSMVGLGLVDNTPDNQKPVSAPQQAALALKANRDNPVFTGTVSGITAAMVGLDRVNNTNDLEKPISTAVAAALAGKVNSNNPVFTGTVTGITKGTVGLGNVNNTADSDKPISDATQAALNVLSGQIVAKPSAAEVAATYAPKANPTFTGTVSGITAAMVGLGAVNNTSDAQKPVSIAQQAALDLKAPLSNPIFTGTVGGITKSMVGLANVDNTSDANKPISTATAAALALRAPLASPTFTGTVGGITKSMVGLGNVDNTSDLAKPISTAVQAALDQKVGAASPTFTGTVSGITKAMVGLGNVDNTADASKPVSSPQQAALNLKAPLASPTFTGVVSGITAAMVGLGNVNNTADSAKPVSAAQQAALDLKAPLASPIFTGTVGGITKSMVGLANVDNTSDALKPISNATQTALDAKAPLASPTFTGTVGGITKAMVGLGAVDNTSDAAKPVSTATAAALALKAPLASPTFTGTVGGITKSMVGLANVDNTPDNQKPVSQAQQAALDGKANINNPVFTGTVGGITKAMVGLGNVDNTSDANKPLSAASTAALAGKVSTAALGVANGVATLGADGKVPLTQLPASVAGGLSYAGSWNASTNVPDLNALAPAKGTYYKVSVAGATIIDGNGGWQVGDLAVYNGTDWDKFAGGAGEVFTVNGLTGNVVLTKADLGLAAVDNTGDLAKPISTAMAAALALKAPLNSPAFTGTVTGIGKAMVGLGNVDNTSDAAKPLSTAMTAALNAKANLASPTFSGTVSGITKAMVGLSNVDNTSDINKPISAAVQAALDTKLGVNDGGSITITKTAVGLGNVDNTSDLAKPVSTAMAAALALKLDKAGGSLTGALNTNKVTMTSLATMGIWAAAGNQISVTGSSTVTGFDAAPQAGAERVLVLAGAAKFTAGPNMLIDGLLDGQTYIGSTYDTITVRALSTTQFRLSISRYDGKAMQGSAGGTTTGTGATGEVTFTGNETLSNKTLTNPALTRQSLVDGTTVNWNCDLGSFADLQLDGTNRNMAAPTKMKPGMYFLYIKQGAGGGKVIASWNAVFKWSAGAPPVLSTQQGALDMLVFVCDGTTMMGELWVKGAAEVTLPTVSLDWGTNLSGPEWTRPGLRYGTSSNPNIDFAFARAQEIQWLAQQGLRKNRLCIQWELLQPVRASKAQGAGAPGGPGVSSNVLTGYGVSSAGAFYNVYAQYIQAILDAHSAAGTKCIIDLHNYCRYQDFIYAADGTVAGFVDPSDPLIQPYTTDSSKVRVEVMSLASNSRLPISDFTDFWTRVANQWKNHPGLGGYGLMNEPHDMPIAGGNVPWNEPFVNGNVQDYSIWPTFAQAAINAIRAVDPNTPIYVSGNEWDSAMAISGYNPGFPLNGTNLVYEVHAYLDANSAGYRFDYDYEVGLGYSAGENGPITTQTGVNRVMQAITWAAQKNVKLALTEFGLPLHRKNGVLDNRWVNMYKAALQKCYENNVEVYSWMSGNHWPIQGYPLNHVPQWHQNRTLEPHVGGVMKEVLGVSAYTVFDEGGSWSSGGSAVTITVFIRGNTTQPININVSSDNGGSLSKSQLVIPAGANGSDSFVFVPGSDKVTTLNYVRSDGGQVPPARVVYSLLDPVAYAGSTSLTHGARALMAKRRISMWNAYDAYTDYVNGQSAGLDQDVRAVADSGFFGQIDNPMQMLEFHNHGPNSGFLQAAKVSVDGAGRKFFDLNNSNVRVGWCKKRRPNQDGANTEPSPLNVMPFSQNDQHFFLGVLSIPSTTGNNGVIIEASETESNIKSRLEIVAGAPRWSFTDSANVSGSVSGAPLSTNVIHTISLVDKPGAQKLRVNRTQVGTDTRTHAANSWFNQLLIGGGWSNYFPSQGFIGRLYLCMAGPTDVPDNELTVLEQYAAAVAGLASGSNLPATSAPAPAPSPAPSPAPTPAPAPATATDADLLAIVNADSTNRAFWDPSFDASRHSEPDGTGTVTAYDETIGRLDDRGNGGHHFVWPQFDAEPQYEFGGGKEWAQVWVPATLSGMGGSTTGLTFIAGVRVGPGYYNTILSDVAGVNTGYSLRYSGDDGGITFSVGTGTGRVSVMAPVAPNTDVMVAAWHDNTNINIQIDSGQVYSAAVGAAAAGSSTMQMWSNPGGGDYFYGFFFGGVLAKSGLDSAKRLSIRSWAAGKLGAVVGGGSATPPPPPPAPAPGPTPQVGGAMPTKVLGTYWPAWDTNFSITDVPMDFNVIFLFHIRPNDNTGGNNAGNGTFVFPWTTEVPASAVQAVRNRGQKVILTAGGAGQGYSFDNRTKSQNFVNSVVQIISNLGGVDGLDFNNFEAGIGSSSTEMIWIAQQMRATYGSNFAITAPPSANAVADRTMLKAMYDAGVLNWAAPQMYDWSHFKEVNVVRDYVNEWVGVLGNEQAVAVGMSANYDFTNSMTLAECQREWDSIFAAHPNIRGVFCWNAVTNLQSSPPNQWGAAMKQRVIGSGSSVPPPQTGGIAYPFGSRVDYPNGYPFGIRPTNTTQSQMDASVIASFRAWRNNNVIRQSNVTSYWTAGTNAPFDGNRNIAFVKFGENWASNKATVSEGMGYGMLITVLMSGYNGEATDGWPANKVLFDEMFTLVRMRPCYGWMNDHAQPLGRYLMDWELWPNLSSKGAGYNAMDGDLDIALALLMAHRQWGSNGAINYLQEALNTIAAIKATTMVQSGQDAGATLGLGFSHVSRTSDYMIGHFRSFAKFLRNAGNTTDANFWETTVIDKCFDLCEQMRSRFSPIGLQPDFIVNVTGVVTGQSFEYGGRPAGGDQGTFPSYPIPSPGGYGDRNNAEKYYFANAQRNPWRFGTDYVLSGDTRFRDICDRLSTFFKNDCNMDPRYVPAGFNLDGTINGVPLGRPFPTNNWVPVGMTGPMTVGAMVTAQQQSWLNALWAFNSANFDTAYYNAELQLLPMIVASGNWWRPEGSATTAAQSATPTSLKVAEVGHSLLNQTMPDYLVQVANAANKPLTLRAQVIGGVSLKYNWDNHTQAETSGSSNPQIGDVFTALPGASPAFDMIVLTELVIPPLPSSTETKTYMENWRNRAKAAKASVKPYYYSTWAGDTDRAAWYTNTGSNASYFEGIVDQLNGSITGADQKWGIIPAHAVMRRVYEDIQNGLMPWATGGIDYFFADGFHCNNRGWYIVALTQYATLFQVNPSGVIQPSGIGLTTAQVNQLQTLVWNVVSNYSRRGW
jgi:hypothetical protein